MSADPLRFFVGLHQPHDARHFSRAYISINRLRSRRSAVPVPSGAEVLIDSGAFTEISTHGAYRHTVAEYAADLRRIRDLVPIVAVVAQDWMCEPFIVAKTGLSVAEHQRLTIERYDELLEHDLPAPAMPVLQGFDPADYRRHIDAYGDRLVPGMWVGVGSVCKRNASPVDVLNVLATIAGPRPDLRLHGFGLKRTALMHGGIRALLHSADSMAWSYAARRERRNPNDWREAAAFEAAVLASVALGAEPWQASFDWGAAA